MNPLLARLRVGRAEQAAGRASHGLGYAVEICHHCGNPPPCAQACPEDAFYYDARSHAAVIAQERCTRCMECVPACPFGVMYVAPDGELLKCDLCGGEPACVEACATRPERGNPGRQYQRAPALFYSDAAAYRAVLQRRPQAPTR